MEGWLVKHRPELWRLLLIACVLAAGFLPVWAVLGTWITSVCETIAATDRTNQSFSVLRDGTPVIVELASDRRTIRDLDGNALTPERGDETLYGRHVYLAAKRARPAAIDDWNQRIRVYSDGPRPATYWYLISDGRVDGTAYFVGYDSESKARVGFIGTAGFRETSLPQDELIPFSGPAVGPQAPIIGWVGLGNSTRFPISYTEWRGPPGYVSQWDVYVLGRDEAIYHFDLRRRSVEEGMRGIAVASAAYVGSPDDFASGTALSPAVRTDDAVIILDVDGREQRRYPIPEPLRGMDFSFLETKSRGAVMYWAQPQDGLMTESEYRIFHVAPDGQFRETDVKLPCQPYLRTTRIASGAILPAPAVAFVVMAVSRTEQLMSMHLVRTYGEAFVLAVTQFWPSLAVASFIGVVCAVLCYRRLVRYRASRSDRIVWTSFVLLLGLPGWIGFRFGRAWPVLEECPSCRTTVPRDRETCVGCAEAFPGPALKGTEVFA
jgi:hypothetical protein